jgi:hypothetical protein
LSWNAPPEALPSLLLTILLFSIARRGNAWIGVHEWLSRTRVVERNVHRPAASAAPKRRLRSLFPTFRRCGASDRTPYTR